MIKTIFFDIGGVLLNIHPERTIEYLSSKINLPENDIINYFPEEVHHQYERGEISDNDFFGAVKNDLPNSIDLTSEHFWHAWSILVGDETGVMETMNKLTDNYNVWLLSNTNPYHIFKEERDKLFSKIKGGIYSFEVGSRKPEKMIFQKALQIADTLPEQSLFIDDLKENVEMAQKLNFKTIHFTSEYDLTYKFAQYGIN